MKNVMGMILLVGFFTFGCDMPQAMNPDADSTPTAEPTPPPEANTPPNKPSDPPAGAEVVPYCEMKTLDPGLLVEKSGDQIADIRVAANDKGFAISWRNNLSSLPTMFRSFGWDMKPTSDVVHLGNMYLGWNNGLVGGTDDYLTVESKFESGTEIPPQPFKYNFRRVSASGELIGAYSAMLQFGERDGALNVIFDGKYYRVTSMRRNPVGCPTFIDSYQVGVTGVLVHDASKCVYLGDDPVNAAIRSVLPMGDDVLVAYDQHPGGSGLKGFTKIVGLKGPTDWEPLSGISSFTFLLDIFNTSNGLEMLWVKGGENFISSLEDGKITKSYAFSDPMGTGSRVASDYSIYGLRFNQLDNRHEFLRADLKGKTISKIDIKSPITDSYYATGNRGGKFIIANFNWYGSKKPELRTISCQ